MARHGRVGLGAALAAVTLGFGAMGGVFAADTAIGKEPGELWESTVQMTMKGADGMAMPPQTQQVCRPKNWTEPPGAEQNKDCEMTQLERSGPKMTWTVVCKGKTPGTGTGEIVFEGPQRYSGTMTMETGGHEMVMKLSGRSLGKECDAAQLKRQVAAMERQAKAATLQHEQSMAQLCAEGVREMSTVMFAGPAAFCKDAAQKDAFCARLGTREGFQAASAGGNANNLKQAGEYCGMDPAVIRKELCTDAARSESLEFLGKSCPDEARPIAERECAGRKYTALQGTKYGAFCVAYAGELLGGSADQAAKTEEPADPKAGAMDKAKKKLKGLFGR